MTPDQKLDAILENQIIIMKHLLRSGIVMQRDQTGIDLYNRSVGDALQERIEKTKTLLK